MTTIGERQAIAEGLCHDCGRTREQHTNLETRHPLCDTFVATTTTNAPVADRANDKPPAHWTPDDKCERHPQTAEEWDWHADNPNGPSRSLKRLNYAADRADPHAPDQMALVLRIDIMRLEGDYIHQKARADGLKRRLDALAIDAPQTLPIHGEMREALEGFINDLTDHGRNRANCLSIDHDALNARIIAARNALQGDT